MKLFFAIVCGSHDYAGDVPTTFQVRTIPAFFAFAGILNEIRMCLI